MKLNKKLAIGVAALVLSGAANAVIITQEDFETGATGWSDNLTTDGGTTFTRFLGRFNGAGGVQQNSKTYSLSGNQTQVTIELDFYEIDSWDYEYFNIFIDDTQVISNEFKHNREDFANSPFMDAQALLFTGDDGNVNYGFASWPDQGYRYSITINTTATSLKLGFGATISSGIPDEAWGVDNILIVDNVSTIPVPAAVWLFGTGLLALIGVAKRKTA